MNNYKLIVCGCVGTLFFIIVAVSVVVSVAGGSSSNNYNSSNNYSSSNNSSSYSQPKSSKPKANKCEHTDLNGKQTCTRDAMSGSTLCRQHFEELDNIYKDLEKGWNSGSWDSENGFFGK